MSLKWFEFKINTPSDWKELLSEKLFEMGAQAVNETLSNPNQLQAYFSEDQKDQALGEIEKYSEFLKAQNPKLSSIQVQIIPVAEENWAETYKKYYTAQHLTDLFFLRPKWDNTTPIPSGMIPIFMDPGQAFGTGLHPSTRLCLKTLQTQITESLDKSKMRCLDVGTGSGILALAIYHLGVKEVVGVDNDPVAIEVAKENMALNSVTKIDLSTVDIRKLKGPFDVLVSNILLETHRELAPEYLRLLPQGGLLLLSGLLGYQKNELFNFLLPMGFALLESRNFQEWASFLFIRRGGR